MTLPQQTTTTLRIVEQFHAEQAEGPLRLFRKQDAAGGTVYPVSERQTLVVERYDQIQHWHIDDALQVQQDRDSRYREQGLLNADRSDPPAGAEAVDIPHTEQLLATALDPLQQAETGRWLPRTKSFRVRGGYLSLHGPVGAVSRHILFPGELP